jgi:predicted transcriptional regulator
MEMLIDLENWNYFLENPNETIEKGEALVTNNINLTQLDFEVLSAIKYNNISSIRDLADKMHKDVKTIQPKVHKLSENGFIQLIDGNKNSKIPILNYDEIRLEI